MNNRSVIILFSVISSLFSGMHGAASAGASGTSPDAGASPSSFVSKIKFNEDADGNMFFAAYQENKEVTIFNITRWPTYCAQTYHTMVFEETVPVQINTLKWLKGTGTMGIINSPAHTFYKLILDPLNLSEPTAEIIITPHALPLLSAVSPNLTYHARFYTSENTVLIDKISSPIGTIGTLSIPEGERVVQIRFNQTSTFLAIVTNIHLHIINLMTMKSRIIIHDSSNPWIKFMPGKNLLMISCGPSGVATMDFEGNGMHAISVSKAGKKIQKGKFISDEGEILLTLTDGSYKLWNTSEGRSFSLDGYRMVKVTKKLRLLATLKGENEVHINEFNGDYNDYTLAHDKPITDIAFNEEHELLLSASEDKTIKVWDYNSGEAKLIETIHTSDIPVRIASYKKMVAYQTADKLMHAYKLDHNPAAA